MKVAFVLWCRETYFPYPHINISIAQVQDRYRYGYKTTASDECCSRGGRVVEALDWKAVGVLAQVRILSTTNFG